jgi:hypothetical protein
MNILVVVIISVISYLLGFITVIKRREYYQNTGESNLSKLILQSFLNAEYHLMNNITLPFEDGTTQIDHILVSTHGIFVIETKHYSGWIFGNENSKYWTQVIFNFKSRFQNPVNQNYKHFVAIKSLLDFVSPDHIHSIIVFTGNSEFKTTMPQNVVQISDIVNYIRSFKDPVFSANRMQFCIGRIEAKRFQISRKTDVEHQEYLYNKYYNRKRY